ncbi:hypothetical protein J5Y17_17850 [Celeribacter sp. PS-C1]|nr:hypothetical protein [Celeribacter sp. PS-C1]
MAINVAVLVVFVFLSVLQFDQVRTGLEQERLKVIADRVSEPLGSAAMIGLELSTVRNLDAVLERARQADDAITALHVLDRNGAIVRSTSGSVLDAERAEIGQLLAEGASSAIYKERGDYRYLAAFKQSSGDVAGALMIEYSGATATTAVWAMAGRLATWALGFCVISSVISAWMVRSVFKHELRFDQEFLTADFEASQHLWRGDTINRKDGGHEGIASAMHEAELQYLNARDGTR